MEMPAGGEIVVLCAARYAVVHRDCRSRSAHRSFVDSQRPSDIVLPIIPSAARAGAKFGARCGGTAVSILSPG